RSILLSLTASFTFAATALAQEPEKQHAAATVPVESASSFDPAAATQAWLNTVPPEKRAKSDAYFEGGYWLILWNFLLTIAISIFLLVSRFSARLRDFAERICRGSRWLPQGSWQLPLQIVLYAIPYFLIMALLSFPLNLYENFYREHQYGFATQSFVPWFREELIGLSLILIGGVVVL